MACSATNICLQCKCAFDIGAVFVFVMLTGCPAKPSTWKQSGPLFVREDTLWLGELWAERGHIAHITVFNPSQSAIRIDDFFMSCSCTNIRPRSFELGPDEELDLELEVNLLAALGDADAFDTQDFEIQISPIIGGESQAQPWTVAASVRGALLAEQRQIDFADEITFGGPTPERVVYMPAHPLVRSVLVDGKGLVDVSVTRHKEGFELAIAPKEKLREVSGEFRHLLPIEAKAASGETLVKLDLPVIGTVGTAIQLYPNSLHFGLIGKQSIPAEANVTVANNDETNFRIIAVNCPDEFEISLDDDVTGNVLQIGDTASRMNLNVVLNRVEIGAKARLIELKTDAGYTIPLRVGYHVVE